MYFIKESNYIYRLKVPFNEIYTSVFLIKNDNYFVLVDCATTQLDVDEYIIPALTKILPSKDALKYVVITHNHADHAGGLSGLLEIYPQLKVVRKAQFVSENIQIYEMFGHTTDCIGVLDLRDGVLISGDGLQGYGVGKYRCYLEDKNEYLKTLEKIKKDKRIANILFAHEYEPWFKDSILGRMKVEKCLQDCLDCILKGETENESNCNK